MGEFSYPLTQVAASFEGSTKKQAYFSIEFFSIEFSGMLSSTVTLELIREVSIDTSFVQNLSCNSEMIDEYKILTAMYNANTQNINPFKAHNIIFLRNQ